MSICAARVGIKRAPATSTIASKMVRTHNFQCGLINCKINFIGVSSPFSQNQTRWPDPLQPAGRIGGVAAGAELGIWPSTGPGPGRLVLAPVEMASRGRSSPGCRCQTAKHHSSAGFAWKTRRLSSQTFRFPPFAAAATGVGPPIGAPAEGRPRLLTDAQDHWPVETKKVRPVIFANNRAHPTSSRPWMGNGPPDHCDGRSSDER